MYCSTCRPSGAMGLLLQSGYGEGHVDLHFAPILSQASVSGMGDVLAPYIYVFYAAFVVAFIFTPIMRQVAMHYGIIDQPDGKRKMHSTPVAYLGGIAVFLGWMAGLACSQFLHLHREEPGLPGHVIISFGIVAGACVIVLLGLWDDTRGVSPWSKIAGQMAAAAFLLWQGIGTRCAEPLLTPIGDRLVNLLYSEHLAPLTLKVAGVLHWPLAGDHFFAPWFLLTASSAFVVMVVVGCCNAANLMDGLDGLCGGVTSIIAGGFLFLAVHLAASGSAMNSNLDGTRVVLALALLGGVLGFVPYNFNPASIFMGDTGSMFLGFSCATMILLMGQGQHPKWFLASTVMFALPVLDTALAFVRRYVNGRPLFSPDKQHIHHQLVGRGFSVKQTVLISYGLAMCFALLGALIVYLRTRFAGAFYLVIFGSIIVAAYKMGMVHEKPAKPSPKMLGEGEESATGKGNAPAETPELPPVEVAGKTAGSPSHVGSESV